MTFFKSRTFSKGAAPLFIIGIGLSMLVFVGVFLLATLIVSLDSDPTSKIDIAAFVSLIISSAISGIVLTRLHGKDGLKYTALTSLLLSLIMILISIFLSSGALSGGAFMNALCYFGVSMLTAFIGRGGRRRKRR
ncbi:MAG: hypothetical protein IJX92_05320 [Clostridia bacterium]|nr:hypothetical protein [Clostridia bacterium]